MKALSCKLLGVKLGLLLSYLLLLFVLARLHSLVTWCVDRRWRQPELTSLTVDALTEILEERRIDYQDAIEKVELVRLVQDSGPLTQDEVESVHRRSVADKNFATYLSNSDLFKRVESGNGGIWLLLVLVDNHSSNKKGASGNYKGWRSPLTSKTWTAILKFAGRLGINVGILGCDWNQHLGRWCRSHEVVSSTLLLTLPQPGSKGPSTSAYSKTFRVRPVYRWVLTVLSNNVRRAFKHRLLHDNWSPSQQPETHIVLITSRPEPEPFFAIVAARFPDLAKFAWLNVVKGDTTKQLEKWAKDLPGIDANSLLPLPAILVANSEGMYVYGQGSRRFMDECFTDRCLMNFLIHLYPTGNAGLCVSFVGVIFLAGLEFFIPDLEDNARKRAIRSGVIYFLVIGGLWATLSSDDTGVVGEDTLTTRLSRYMSLTSVGALIRHDVLLYTESNSGVVVLLFSLLPAFFLIERLARILSKYTATDTVTLRSYKSKICNGTPWYASTRPLPQLQKTERPVSQDDSRGRERDRTSRSTTDQGRNRSRRSNSSMGQNGPRFSGSSGLDGRRVVIRTGSNRTFELNEEGLQAFLRYLEQTFAGLENLRQRPDYIADQLPEWSHGRERPPEALAGFDCETCVICWEGFSEGDSMTGLPCSHIFHRACVVTWLNSGVFNACPLCRK